MKMTKTAEYTFSGRKIPLANLAEILEDARYMCATEVDIHQTSYEDRPYGTSTTTTITIEQRSPMTSGEGY
jgi:hypothetical protein